MDTQTHFNKNILYLHIAVMLFGLAGVVAQFVEVSAVMVALGRVICSSALLLIIALVKKDRLRLDSKRDVLLIILTGAVMAAHWTTFFQSIQVSTVAIGTITFSTFPLFLTFLEPIIFHEKIRRQSIFSAIILFIGVLITIPEFSMANDTTIGIIWGMICSLTYAILTLANRYFSARYAARTICLYEQCPSGVCCRGTSSGPVSGGNHMESAGHCRSCLCWLHMYGICTFPVCVRPEKRESSDRRNRIRNGNRLWNCLCAAVPWGNSDHT